MFGMQSGLVFDAFFHLFHGGGTLGINQVVYKANGLLALALTIFQASGTTDGIMLLPLTTEDEAAYHPLLQSVCSSVTPTILSGLSSTHAHS